MSAGTKNASLAEVQPGDVSQPETPKKRRGSTGPRKPSPRYVAIRVVDENGDAVEGARLEVLGNAKDSDGTRVVLGLYKLRDNDPAVTLFCYTSDGSSFEAV